MLPKYLDVSNLMKAVSLSTLMMSAIMSKEQRLLLMFQRKQIVEDRASDDISSNDDSNEDFAETFQTQINSQKPMDRIFAIGKMTSILREYETNELNSMDKKLVKGFYARNLNEYGYLARSSKSKSSPSPLLKKSASVLQDHLTDHDKDRSEPSNTFAKEYQSKVTTEMVPLQNQAKSTELSRQSMIPVKSISQKFTTPAIVSYNNLTEGSQ